MKCLILELQILHESTNCYKTKNNLKIKDIFLFYSFLKEHDRAFLETREVCSISIKIRVLSAACKRTFSNMKRVKHYLRNCLLDANLNNII